MKRRVRAGGLVAALVITVTGCAGPLTRPAAVTPPALRGSTQTGRASWYGQAHHGQMTASGERFDMHALTAAHPTLPFGTWVRVVNLDNDRAVEVRINDRGPVTPGRIIDLSYAAARALGAIAPGVIPVRLTVLGTADLPPSDTVTTRPTHR
jgi:rare lipoprotein A